MWLFGVFWVCGFLCGYYGICFVVCYLWLFVFGLAFYCDSCDMVCVELVVVVTGLVICVT